VIIVALALGYMLGQRSGDTDVKVSPTGHKILVIGVDGAEWAMIRPLMDEGRLPTFSRLVREGASGNLRSLKPTLSPIIWTSIATGKTPEKHGISYFHVRDPEHSRRFPVQSTMRQCKAVWSIVSDLGLTAGVIGWWASYPAESVNGFVVSDDIAYHACGLSGKRVKETLGKTYPATLYDQAAAKLRDPLSITKRELDGFIPLTDEEYEFSVNSEFDFGNPLHHFMYSLATGMAYRDMGLELYKQYQPDWMGIYFEQVDSLSHIFVKYAPPKMEGMAVEFFEKYKDVIASYYSYQDRIIADFIENIDRDTVVIVCSDHGFKTGDKRLTETEGTSLAKAHLWHEIEGVVIFWGPPIRKGARIEGASVMDVTPTALYLLGAPVARDMDGKVLFDAIKDDFRSEHPVRSIDTYESAAPETRAPVPDDSGVDEEVIARLEALGYIGDQLNDDEVRQNRVRAHLQKGDARAARAEVEQVLEKDPYNKWARLMMARIQEQEGNAGEAEKIFRELVEDAWMPVQQRDRPIYAEALEAVAVYDHMAGNTEDAVKGLERALELNPQNPNTAYNLGVILESGEDYIKAIDYYKKAIEINPDHALAHNNLGNCYQKVGEIQKAIAEYKKTAEVEPRHVECHYNLAVLYHLIGRVDDALAEFEAALEVRPDFAPASVALGDLYIQKADYEKAASIFEKLLQSDPKNPKHLYLWGKALALKGDVEKGRENIRKARAIDPSGVENALELDSELDKLIGPLDPSRP
jgi:tetratricopeptide (TPR) repeat protein